MFDAGFYQRRWLMAILGVVLWGTLCGSVRAQVVEDVPEEIRGLEVKDLRGNQLPLEMEFTNSFGQRVRLADLFHTGQPVILTFNYSDCPMLCSLQLNGMVAALREIPWTLGEEYKIITVSLDPRELPEKARLSQRKYLTEYGRTPSSASWDFLVGKNEDIERLAAAAGFGYRYVADQDEYVHTPTLIVCSPDGRISRYLSGVWYDQNMLQSSLQDASRGTIGSALEQFLLYCFHYDATKGRFGSVAMTMMRLAGLLTVAVMGVVLLRLVYFERHRDALLEQAPQ